MQFIGLQGEDLVWGPFLSLCFVFRSSWRGFPESPAQPCSGGRLQSGQSILGHREVALDCGLPEHLLPGASVPSGLHGTSQEDWTVVPLMRHLPEDPGWSALELGVFLRCSGVGSLYGGSRN